MEILGLGLLQWLNWPLRFVWVVIIKPLARLVTGNPYWPDEPGPDEPEQSGGEGWG